MNAEVFGSPIFVRRATVMVQEIAGLAQSIFSMNGRKIAET
ncbi:hypothetical protein [Mesorhizobium sp. WSM2561]